MTSDYALQQSVKALWWMVAAIGAGSIASSAVAESPTQALPEHAVTIHFSYGSTDLSRLLKLEKKLEEAIVEHQAGRFDGDEMAADGSDGYLYMYGPDGDRLFQVIEPILLRTPFMRGASVKIRYGRATEDVRVREIAIAP